MEAEACDQARQEAASHREEAEVAHNELLQATRKSNEIEVMHQAAILQQTSCESEFHAKLAAADQKAAVNSAQLEKEYQEREERQTRQFKVALRTTLEYTSKVQSATKLEMHNYKVRLAKAVALLVRSSDEVEDA